MVLLGQPPAKNRATPPPIKHNECHIEFAGEWHTAHPQQHFWIGSKGNLKITDAPLLEPVTIKLVNSQNLWWVCNISTFTSLAIHQGDGLVTATLPPTNALPLIYPHTVLVFNLGNTTFEINLFIQPALTIPQLTQPTEFESDNAFQTEQRRKQLSLQYDQKILVLALAERQLRTPGTSRMDIPRSKSLATKLGWSESKFNRKLDYLCQKLSKAGVPNLYLDGRRMAKNRRIRLVDFALSAHLITKNDLPLLDKHLEAVSQSNNDAET